MPTRLTRSAILIIAVCGRTRSFPIQLGKKSRPLYTHFTTLRHGHGNKITAQPLAGLSAGCFGTCSAITSSHVRLFLERWLARMNLRTAHHSLANARLITFELFHDDNIVSCYKI